MSPRKRPARPAIARDGARRPRFRSSFTSIRSGLISLAAILVLAAQAQNEEGLYTAPPPDDAALIRVASTLMRPIEGVTVHRVRFGDLGFGQVLAYRAVQAGERGFDGGGTEGTLDLVAGRYYTLVWQAEGAVLREDPILSDRLKTLVSVVNLSSRPVTLFTTDRRIEVLGATRPGGSAAVEINPVAVAFALVDDTGASWDVEAFALERANAFTIFVFERDGALIPRVVRSTLAGQN